MGPLRRETSLQPRLIRLRKGTPVQDKFGSMCYFAFARPLRCNNASAFFALTTPYHRHAWHAPEHNASMLRRHVPSLLSGKHIYLRTSIESYRPVPIQ